MPKCDFNKFALQFRHGCSPINLLHFFWSQIASASLELTLFVNPGYGCIPRENISQRTMPKAQTSDFVEHRLYDHTSGAHHLNGISLVSTIL